jgi:hypothetical protein
MSDGCSLASASVSSVSSVTREYRVARAGYS